ncbi:hypothetical protein NC653_001502 [Populus alba x Populus x berolinensis]|uniref:Uncharacterized protein n=1 Tax=Populus alba x Populus x berolinensis TaxID=444605 RepID=A0AAD6RLB5_9ROSI|nr:hypothetical protein NC653_001502 [Populus alba x Populus x berolinensis]
MVKYMPFCWILLIWEDQLVFLNAAAWRRKAVKQHLICDFLMLVGEGRLTELKSLLLSLSTFFSLQAPATTVTIWGRVDDQLELLVLAGVERGSQRCRGCFGLKEMLLLSVWMASAGGGLAAGLLMAGGYQLLLVWGLGAGVCPKI